MHEVELVWKMPVYGFHSEKKPFLKITIYDPAHVKRCSELLYQGAVFGHSFQPYEAHLTYYMHFYTDLNLFGMQFLKITNFKFRRGLP